MSMLGTGIAAVVAGALDGLGASADTAAGRNWDTPGVGFDGPVLAWGFAPAVQIATLGTGVVAQVQGIKAARGLTAAGAGMIARAIAFKLAQRGGGVPTQGFRHSAFDPPGMSREDRVASEFGGRVSAYRQPPFVDYDNQDTVASEFGGRVSAYLADGTNVPAGEPQNSYVSNFGYLADGTNVPKGVPQSHYVSTYGFTADDGPPG